MKDRAGYPIPAILGGINTNREDAQGSLKDALNVYEERGSLRTRKAWKSVGAGPVIYRAANRVSLATGAPATVNREFTAGDMSDELYVGSNTVFDGFHWGHLTSIAYAGAQQRLLVAEYWNGTTWTAFPWILDQTQGVLTGGTRRATLTQEGKVHWHRPTDWAQSSYNSLTRYWVRIKPVRASTPNAADWDDYTFQIRNPGIRPFTRPPVNGLVAVRIQNAYQALVCADNKDAGILEPGANIGRWPLSKNATEELQLVRRSTGGVWGVYSSPAAGGGTSNVGTTARFTDLGPTGGEDGYTSGLYSDKAPTTIAFEDVTVSTATVNQFSTPHAGILELEDNTLEEFIAVTVVSGGGPAVGEARQITSHTALSPTLTVLQTFPAWSAAPTATTEFVILKPAHLLASRDQDNLRGLYQLSTGSTNTLSVDTNEYARDPQDDYGGSAVVHFAVLEAVRWTLQRGRRYSFVNDPVDGSLIFSNGSRLLTYDGETLQTLKAAPEDDPRVEAALGALTQSSSNGIDPRTLAYEAKFYRTPPAGKYLATHLTHIFVAGSEGKPNTVRWSMPGDYRQLWPLLNEAIVHCPFNEPISGIVSYYDRLIAFTKRSIHEGVVTPTGFSFRQIAGSAGFSSHHAVCKVPLSGRDVLIGPHAGGLIACTGSEPASLISEWELVLPDPGIDLNDLENTCAVFWKQRSLYLLAIKLKGRTSRNLILAYNTTNNRAWLWSMPFGVASLALVTSPAGEEEVLVGTEDGTLTTLIEGDTDDGQAFTGTLLTHPISPSQTGQTVELVRVSLEGRIEGATKTVDLTVFRNEATARWTTGNVPLQTGETQYGTGVYGTATFAPGDFARRQVNMPNGTIGRSFAIQATLQPRTTLRSITLDADVLTRER